MPSVSRTLWSVMSTPMLRALSAARCAGCRPRESGRRRRRLVEQHEARLGGQRARDLDAAPLAARQALAELARCGRCAAPRAATPAPRPAPAPRRGRPGSPGSRGCCPRRSACGKRASAEVPDPSRARRCIGSPVSSRSSSRCGRRRKAQADDHVEAVVLPAPFGPSRPTTSPELTSSDRSTTTWRER